MKLIPQNLTKKIGFDAVRQAALAVAQSAFAKEQLEKLAPSSREGRVRKQLTQTGEMMDLLQNEAAFPLHHLFDVREYVKTAKPEGSMLPLKAFQEILKVSVIARRVKYFIKKREGQFRELKKVSNGLIPLKELENAVKAVIDEQGNLRNDASSELKRIRNRLNKKRNDLRKAIEWVMKNASKKGMTSDEGPTLRGGRMVIPVQAEYKRKIKGFVHDVSSSGQTVYLEPVEALEINNAIRQLEGEEKREIERILRTLTGRVRQNRKALTRNYETLGMLDVIMAKAEVSIKLNGFIPKLSESSRLYLCEAYNPILLLKNLGLKEEEREAVIPLFLELNEKESCLIITGPNAGGKSVAMKTAALCVMMAQSGFAIPVKDSSELPVYDSLFVDMGDDQSIENDLSTFSSRLQWMKKTQKAAGKRSLVLIDEAAAGTDPEEGGALFQAFIKSLIERGARILVTTHHGSLKVFAHDHQRAINGSMEFDQKSLSPTYRFKKGVPGSSYAFEIAERMDLKEALLAEARRLLGEAKNNMEMLITELEEKTQQAGELKKKYDKLQSKTEAERNRYQEKRSGIEKEKEAIREKALNEAKEIMQTANRQIEQAVEKAVAQEKKDSEAIKEARKEVEEHKEMVERQLKEVHHKKERRKRTESDEEPPKPGDLVRLEDSQTTGELKEVNGDRAVVMANGLRIKTKRNKLAKVKDVMEKVAAQPKVSVNVERPYVKPSLEIRGMRGEEAMKKVVKYLDNAIASGRNEVDIIHGKGEGILKNLVHEYLEKRKEVRDYKIAPLSRGGAGCTIVKL